MYSECSFVMPDQKPIFSIENKFQDLQVRRRIWELDRMSIQLCSPLWVLLSSCSSSCASSYNSLPSMIQSPNPQSKQQKTLHNFFFLGLVFKKTGASLTQPILVWWTFPWWKIPSLPLKLEVRNKENLWGIHPWSQTHWQIQQVG